MVDEADEYDYEAIEEGLLDEASSLGSRVGGVESRVYVEDTDGHESVLMRLVQAYDWAAVLSRISTHPDETRIIGYQRRTPLHFACDQDAPSVVIQALLKAFPESSISTGTSNMTPLHITCSSQLASVHVVRVFLENGLREQYSMRDVDGDTPLHAACRCGAPIEVLELLLRAHPGAVNVRDFEGLTPLLRLWVRYFVILGADTIESVKQTTDLSGELLEAWNKTELLLRCAHYGHINTPPPLYYGYASGEHSLGTSPTQLSKSFLEHSSMRMHQSILHAAAAVDCPRAILKIATQVYSHQLEARDNLGRTPLMIAASAPIFKVRDLSDDGYTLEDFIHGEESSQEDENDHSYNDNYNQRAWSDEEEDTKNNGAQQHASVIEILLQANASTQFHQGAALFDPSGRLALHMALESGKPWHKNIKKLVKAHPESVAISDGASKLPPFVLASLSDSPNAVNNTFELLRINPTLLQKRRSGSSERGWCGAGESQEPLCL
jgi:ankyrin repeat protein